MSSNRREKLSYVPLYFDMLETHSVLTDEQFGRLIRAGLIYARDGKEQSLNAPESYLFPTFKSNIDRNKETYKKRCEQNQENIRKRWDKDNTTVYDPIQPYTNDTNTKNKNKTNTKFSNQEDDELLEIYKETARAWAVEQAKAQGVLLNELYDEYKNDSEALMKAIALAYLNRDEDTPIIALINENLPDSPF